MLELVKNTEKADSFLSEGKSPAGQKQPIGSTERLGTTGFRKKNECVGEITRKEKTAVNAWFTNC